MGSFKALFFVFSLCFLAVVNAQSRSQVNSIAQALRQMYASKKYDQGFFIPANVVRMAFHDAGTWSNTRRNGGAHGVIFLECIHSNDKCERSLTDNAGLDAARRSLLAFIDQHNLHKVISKADLLQLAALVAIEVTGGPKLSAWDFKVGRRDFGAEQSVTGRLPPAVASWATTKSFMGQSRLGLTDVEIAALLGAHTIGSAHAGVSGHNGGWDWSVEKWDNEYYMNLVSNGWVFTGKDYQRSVRDSRGKIHTAIMLPADFHMYMEKKTPHGQYSWTSPELKQAIEHWAHDEKAWDDVFIRAYTKVMNNGAQSLRRP